MRQYKYMFAQFTFYDRTGIQKLLEAQAEKGWMLDKISNFGWKFRRIQPRKLHYAVTYFPKASAYDPHPTWQQQDLIDFCAHSGWILADTGAQMQIFYNEAENPVPIETDPALELENIHKSAKKNYLPAYFVIGAMAIVQIALQLGQLFSFPLDYLSQNTTAFNWLSQIVLLIMASQEIGGYFLWYRRARIAAAEGAFLETKGHRGVQLALLWVLLIAFAFLIVSLEPKIAFVMAVSLAAMSLMIGGIFAVHGWLKHRGASAAANRTITILSTVILTMLVISVVVFGTIGVMSSDFWEKDRIVGTYEWNGWTFDIYHDPIPLKVEDLTEVSSADYSYEAREQASFLLQKGTYSQRIWGISDLPELRYTIYETRFDWILSLCEREVLAPSDYVTEIDEAGNEIYDIYVRIDDPAWGAEEVWQRVAGDYAYRDFVLVFGDRIVCVQPSWDLTQEQKSIAGRTLG